MILGIGNDLIDIRRIEKTLERFGDRFVQRIFTSDERARSERRRLRAASYAKTVCRQGSVFQSAWNGVASGRFLARYGRQQFAVWQADHASYQWRVASA